MFLWLLKRGAWKCFNTVSMFKQCSNRTLVIVAKEAWRSMWLTACPKFAFDRRLSITCLSLISVVTSAGNHSPGIYHTQTHKHTHKHTNTHTHTLTYSLTEPPIHTPNYQPTVDKCFCWYENFVLINTCYHFLLISQPYYQPASLLCVGWLGCRSIFKGRLALGSSRLVVIALLAG